MGFSMSGTAVLFIVAAFIAAGTMAVTVTNGIESVTGAFDAAGETTLDRKNADLDITTLTYDAGSNTLTIEANNTRATAFSVSETEVIVDNGYVEHASLTIDVDGDSGTDLWLPGETLHVEYSTSPAPTNVTVVAGPGVSDTEAV